MKVKIIKGIYWVVSLALLLFGIETIKSSFEPGVFFLAILANPFAMSVLIKQNNMDEETYIYGLKLMLCCIGTVIALVIACIVFYKMYPSDVSGTEENFEAILKITMFVVYLLIIYLCESENKSKNYRIFGLFYCMCVASSFFSVSLTDQFISLLNKIPGGGMNMESYKILTEDLIIPIKEAILTYIIFDTAIESKKYNKISRKQDVVNRDYFPV